MHQQLNRFREWSLLACLVLAAACGGGGPPNEGSTATGGPGPTPGKEPTSAPVCEVAHDVAVGAGEAAAATIAFGGGRFAIGWIEHDTGVHVATLDESGSLVGSNVVAAAPRATNASVSALPDGDFLIVWQEPGSVRGARVGLDANTKGAPFSIAPTNSADARPTAAANHVAWTDTNGVVVGELQGTTVAHKATFEGAGDPSLIASSTALGLAFTHGESLGFARLATPVHDVEPAMFRRAAGKPNVPRASSVGDRFFVVWEDGRGGDGNESVYLTTIDAKGKAGDEVLVPEEVGSANYPDVATVKGYAAVVYYQFRDGPAAIYLSLFSPDLHRAGDDLRISGHGTARFPRIASGKDALGVVYAPKGAAARLALLTCR